MHAWSNLDFINGAARDRLPQAKRLGQTNSKRPKRSCRASEPGPVLIAFALSGADVGFEENPSATAKKDFASDVGIRDE